VAERPCGPFVAGHSKTMTDKQRGRAVEILNGEGLKNEVDFLQCYNNQERKKVSKKFCSNLHRTKEKE